MERLTNLWAKIWDTSRVPGRAQVPVPIFRVDSPLFYVTETLDNRRKPRTYKDNTTVESASSRTRIMILSYENFRVCSA